MPYRATEQTEARRAATRERVVAAARELIARGGYQEARVAAVAARAASTSRCDTDRKTSANSSAFEGKWR